MDIKPANVAIIAGGAEVDHAIARWLRLASGFVAPILPMLRPAG